MEIHLTQPQLIRARGNIWIVFIRTFDMCVLRSGFVDACKMLLCIFQCVLNPTCCLKLARFETTSLYMWLYVAIWILPTHHLVVYVLVAGACVLSKNTPWIFGACILWSLSCFIIFRIPSTTPWSMILPQGNTPLYFGNMYIVDVVNVH